MSFFLSLRVSYGKCCLPLLLDVIEFGHSLSFFLSHVVQPNIREREIEKKIATDH
jgi:hypothetical protein